MSVPNLNQKIHYEKIWNFRESVKYFHALRMHFGVTPSIKLIRRYCGEKEEIIFAELQIISNYSGHRVELGMEIIFVQWTENCRLMQGQLFHSHKGLLSNQLNPFLVV